MKKVLALVLCAFSFSLFADPDTDSCGLGWQVTKKKSFLATTTRGTTNSFVPPTFGMTTGTIGCAQHTFAKKEAPAVNYAVANADALTVEMAQGQGEFVAGLAEVMGCDNAAAFGQMTQSNYSSIVSEGVSPLQMYENVKTQIALNPSSCGA